MSCFRILVATISDILQYRVNVRTTKQQSYPESIIVKNTGNSTIQLSPHLKKGIIESFCRANYFQIARYFIVV